MRKIVEISVDTPDGFIRVKGALISYEYNVLTNMYDRVTFTIGGMNQELIAMPANLIKIDERS